MIWLLKIQDAKNSLAPWWDTLKLPSTVKFESGLNLLVGPNGCGKTTVLNFLAKYLHCYQGGFPTVTSTSLDEARLSSYHKPKSNKPAYYVANDNAPAFYFSPDSSVGLIGGMAAFDYDFIDMGIANAQNRLSSGLTSYSRLGRIFNQITKNIYEKKKFTVNWKINKDSSAAKKVAANLQGDMPSIGDHCVLFLDEPERALDAVRLLELYKILKLISKAPIQTICATHSPILMSLPGANIIEFKEGFMKEYLSLIKNVSLVPENSQQKQQNYLDIDFQI